MQRLPLTPSRAVAAALALAAAAAPAALAQDLDVAQKRFVTTIALGHSPAVACYQGARSAASQMRFGFNESSLASCEAALAGELRTADRTATYVNRAIVLTALGRLDAAVSDLNIAIERDPGLQAAHLTIGGVYSRLEQWSAAEAALSYGIALDPSAAVAQDYFTRGGAREELGDIAGARSDYEMAVELAPDWDLARRELARFEVVDEQENGGGGA